MPLTSLVLAAGRRPSAPGTAPWTFCSRADLKPWEAEPGQQAVLRVGDGAKTFPVHRRILIRSLIITYITLGSPCFALMCEHVSCEEGAAGGSPPTPAARPRAACWAFITRRPVVFHFTCG